MAGEFQLQSLEDEDISTWECVDTSGKPVAWNIDPGACLRGSYPPCGNCTNGNCFALGPDAGYVTHVIPAAKIPTEAIGKQVTLTLDAAMWKYLNSDPISVYPIQIDIGSASLTVDMAVNATNSTCEGKRRSISLTFTLPSPGPDGFNFTLWKTSGSAYRTWFDMDNVTLSYDPAVAVGFATNDTVPTQGSQLSTSNSERNRNTGLIIGLGVAALALAAIAAGLLFWFCKRRKSKPSGTRPEAKEQGSDETMPSSLVKPSGAEISSPFTPGVKQESGLSLGGATAAPKAGGLSLESSPLVLGTNAVTHSPPGPPTQKSAPPLKKLTPSSQDLATFPDTSTAEVAPEPQEQTTSPQDRVPPSEEPLPLSSGSPRTSSTILRMQEPPQNSVPLTDKPGARSFHSSQAPVSPPKNGASIFDKAGSLLDQPIHSSSEQSVVSQGPTAPVSLLRTSIPLSEQATISSLESTLASQEQNPSPRSLLPLPDRPDLLSADSTVTVSQPISSSQSLITRPFSSDDAIPPEGDGSENIPRGAQASVPEGRGITTEARPATEIATETGHPSLYSRRQTFTQQTHAQGFSFRSSTSSTSWTTSFSSSSTVQVRNSGGQIHMQTSTRGFSHSG